MKARIQLIIIIILSLCSFMLTIVAGWALTEGVLRDDYLGIGLLILSIAQAIIAFVAADIGRR